LNPEPGAALQTSPDPQAADHPEYSDQSIRKVVFGLLLAIFLAAMDQTVVSIALLAIATDLKDASLMAWLISGYLVAATVCAPLYGKLSDIFGRRRMLMVAIGLYLCASTACALAQTMPQLLVFRVIQGIGGGGLLVLCHAAIADVVPGPQRGRYQGYFSGVFATAALLGPVVGGLLAQYVSWRAIFWVNVPLGILAFIMCERRLRVLNHKMQAVRIDFIGAALLTSGLLLILIALARIGQGTAWHDAGILWSLAGGACVLIAFVLFEFRTAQPIISPSLMRNRTVMVCSGVLALMFFILYGCAILLPLSMQTLEHLSPGEVALRMLPHTLATPFGAFLAGRWMLKHPNFRSLVLTGTTVGTFGLIAIETHALALREGWLVGAGSLTWFTHSAAVALAGFCLGLTMPAAMVAVQSAVSKSEVGIATAMSSFFRQLGGAVGIAVLTSVLFAALGPVMSQGQARQASSPAQLLLDIAQSQTDDPQAQRRNEAALSNGFQSAFILCIAAGLLGIALGTRVPRR
jgi:EmrB/QacA subfamily drug resistance transporter